MKKNYILRVATYTAIIKTKTVKTRKDLRTKQNNPSHKSQHPLPPRPSPHLQRSNQRMTKLKLPLKIINHRKRPMDHHKKCQKIPRPKHQLRMTKVNKVKMTNNRLKSLPPLITKTMTHKPSIRANKMTSSYNQMAKWIKGKRIY